MYVWQAWRASKQWYESGVAFFLNYKDDKEDGMQKRGVKTGKYINHEAKKVIDTVYKNQIVIRWRIKK
jgi:hypothetical protein